MSSRESYDHRKRGRPVERRSMDYGDDDDHNNHTSSDRRDRRRSRSRSPPVSAADGKKAHLEVERQARMARLRAENEQEETRLAALEEKSYEPAKLSATEQIVQVKDEDLEGLEEDERMNLLLGFSGNFGSTKNQKVDDNHKTHAAGVVAKNKARKYRQYMNRKRGFNRPLDKMD